MSNGITTTRDDDVLVVQFSRPEIRSPLSVSVLAELVKIVTEVRGDTSIRGLIFTGQGDVFASGADLREIATVEPDGAADFARRGQYLMNAIADLPQTTVAAVNGYCFGGALDLALACDRRIASASAKFAHPGTGLGIITGWGGTQRLPRLVGTSNALETFFTAAPIDALRALAIGLIDELSDDPLARALEFVSKR
jgi:enoyl-CoA hydratase